MLVSVLLVCMSIFMSVPHCFDYCGFITRFGITNFVLLQGCFGPLQFYVNLSIYFLFWPKKKKVCWDFDRIDLNLKMALGSIDISAILNLCSHEREAVYFSHFKFCLLILFTLVTLDFF